MRASQSTRRCAVALPVLVVLILVFVLISVSCGRSPSTSPGPRSGQPDIAVQTHATSLSDVLRDIDAYPTPRGVSAETWSMLVRELKKQLIARSRDGKTLSIAPAGSANAVSDLQAASDPMGSLGTLIWTERLSGDCNNDGEVSIADLQPIALHYSETSSGPGSSAYLADANEDGEVGITDLQPIANSYSMHLEGYQVWRGANDGTSTTWEPTFRPNVGNPSHTAYSTDRGTSPPPTDHLQYIYTDDISSLADKTNVRYKVVPYGDSAAGVESIEATMEPPSVTDHKVSGTVTESSVGLAAVTMTLTPGGLNATTQADGTYTIMGVANGSYTLTPSKTGYAFTPLSRSVSVFGADVGGQDYTAAEATYSVSGMVIEDMNGLAGVTMTPTPGGLSAITQADGSYAITGVANGSYTLTPSLVNYTFQPTSRAVTVSGADVTGLDFAGVHAGLGGTPWPKFRGNARNTGLSPYVGTQSGALKWTSPSADWFEGSPAIGIYGDVYIGNDNYYFYAYSAADGSTEWTFQASDCVYSSPAVSGDGTIYVGSRDFNVYAIDATGNQRWSHATGGFVYSSPALGVDGTVYVGSYDGTMYALSGLDGSVKWTYATGGPVMSSAALASDGSLYIGAVGVFALNSADGSLKWSVDTAGASVYGAPAVGSDGTVYVGCWNDNVYALNPADGSQKWVFAAGGAVEGGPALGPDGTVYVGSWDKNLYALDPTDGSLKWTFATNGTVRTSPAVDSNGLVFFGSSDGKVYSVNPSDGTEKWSYQTGGAIVSSPAIDMNGNVYIGSNDGHLYAFSDW